MCELLKVIESKGYLGYEVKKNLICIPFAEYDIYIEFDNEGSRYNVYILDNEIDYLKKVDSYEKIDEITSYLKG